MKAEVQEKESRSVQQSMAKWNLGVSRATRKGRGNVQGLPYVEAD